MKLAIGTQVENVTFGLGTVLSIDGSYAMVDFNGTTKKMLLLTLKAPKAKKVKAYMKEESLEPVYTFNYIVNNLKGSRQDRNSMLFFGDNIFNTIEKMADSQNHFAGKIVEDARNGKFVSDKQACVVAYFAKNNGLINA